MAWDVYMRLKINGSDVKGMSDRHIDAVDVNSFDWGMDQEEGESGRTGKLSAQDLRVTRYQDAVSPVFTQAMNENFNVDEIVFTSEQEGEKKDWVFTFTNCRLMNQTWQGTDGGEPVEEELRFKYSEFNLTAASFDDTGAEKGSNDASWSNIGL